MATRVGIFDWDNEPKHTLGQYLFSWTNSERVSEDCHCCHCDRWRHGCRRRAYRDIFMACHWGNSGNVYYAISDL